MSEQAETIQQNDAAPEAAAAAPLDERQMLRMLEAALLTAQEPLSLAEMKKLSEAPLDNKTLEALLAQLGEAYADSGVELTRVASGWRFRARPEMQPYIERLNPQKQPRYSRAVMETLAIIAYRQPVTRGDIEEIRGVAVSSHVLKTLEARGWIDTVGTRDVPGKPALFATTKQMLDDLNLQSLHDLPSLEEVGNLLEAESLPEPLEGERAEEAPAEAEAAEAQAEAAEVEGASAETGEAEAETAEGEAPEAEAEPDAGDKPNA